MLESEFDYEALPTSSPGVHMTAGAIAGVLEHAVMYPLDSVKTRLQSLSPAHIKTQGISQVFGEMVRKEGVWRPLRGMGAMIIGAGPAHALYFATYERFKQMFSSSRTAANHNHLAQGAAGCIATLLHDGVMTPAEVVKQRIQMYDSPYKSIFACAKHIYNTEGFRAFYRSYGTTLVMNVPFQALHFVAYEALQNLTNPNRRYDPKAHVVSGGIAGAVAAAVTTPLDVCKTLLNTQEKGALEHLHRQQVTGLWGAARTVYQLSGATGFFRGLQARVMYQVPSTAICWTVYEFFKFILTKEETLSKTKKSDDDGRPHPHHPLHSGLSPAPGSASLGPLELPVASKLGSF